MKKNKKYMIVKYIVCCENLDDVDAWFLPEVYSSIEEAEKAIEIFDEADTAEYITMSKDWNDSQLTYYGYEVKQVKLAA